MKASAQNTQVETIRNFYRLHARFYQATRWMFLFGRSRILQRLKLDAESDQTFLEVGCGTGHNLSAFANRYPKLRLMGVDISPDMLRVASRRMRDHSARVQWIERPYAPGAWELPQKPDIVLFSYSLTMMNPGWEAALQRAYDDLDPGGIVAVVDFHGSPFGMMHRWMRFNHVRMDKHLLPALTARFTTVRAEVLQAYGGVWSCFLFVGRK